MSASITPAVKVEQRKIKGNPKGTGAAKKDSFSYHVASAQNALSPKVGETLTEAELGKFMLANPNVRVTVNG